MEQRSSEMPPQQQQQYIFDSNEGEALDDDEDIGEDEDDNIVQSGVSIGGHHHHHHNSEYQLNEDGVEGQEDDIVESNNFIHHSSNQGHDPIFTSYPHMVAEGHPQIQLEVEEIKNTNIDTFIDICFLKLDHTSQSHHELDKHRELMSLERYQEKLTLFLQLLKSLGSESFQLYLRLLRKSDELVSAISRLFVSKPSYSEIHKGSFQSEGGGFTQTAIDIVEIISKLYIEHSNSKRLYEHPIQTFLRAKESLNSH